MRTNTDILFHSFSHFLRTQGGNTVQNNITQHHIMTWFHTIFFLFFLCVHPCPLTCSILAELHSTGNGKWVCTSSHCCSHLCPSFIEMGAFLHFVVWLWVGGLELMGKSTLNLLKAIVLLANGLSVLSRGHRCLQLVAIKV